MKTPDVFMEGLGMHRSAEQEEYEDFNADNPRQQRSRRLPQCQNSALHKDVEARYLHPPTSFDLKWLNKLQQYVLGTVFVNSS